VETERTKEKKEGEEESDASRPNSHTTGAKSPARSEAKPTHTTHEKEGAKETPHAKRETERLKEGRTNRR
jgi:hypothetical protein